MTTEEVHPPHLHGAQFLILWLDETGKIRSYGTTSHSVSADMCRTVAPDFEKWAQEEHENSLAHEHVSKDEA